jgi:hypothetical protein
MTGSKFHAAPQFHFYSITYRNGIATGVKNPDTKSGSGPEDVMMAAGGIMAVRSGGRPGRGLAVRRRIVELWKAGGRHGTSAG